MSLTAAFLNSKVGKPNEKSFTDFTDGEGLVARWSKAGSISWYLRYRWLGKPVAFRIGSYPDISIKEARVWRTTCRQMIDTGIDPRVDKKSRIDTRREEQEITVTAAFRHWFDNELGRRRKTPKNTINPIERYILANIGDVPVANLSPQHWLKSFKSMSHAPVYAGNVLIDCKQAMKYCKDSGFCSTDSLSSVNLKMVGSKATPSERVINRRELREIWDYCTSVDGEVYIRYKLCTILIMVMGARSGELRTAHKTDFDFNNKIWTVPEERSKTGHAVVRPIPDRLIPIVKQLISLSPHPYLMLPGRGNKSPVTNVPFCTGVMKVCEALNHADWTAHSFRHTLSTSFADLEIDPFVAEKILGHTMGGVMAIYNKGLYLKQQADAMEKWIDYISTDKDFDLYM